MTLIQWGIWPAPPRVPRAAPQTPVPEGVRIAAGALLLASTGDGWATAARIFDLPPTKSVNRANWPAVADHVRGRVDFAFHDGSAKWGEAGTLRKRGHDLIC